MPWIGLKQSKELCTEEVVAAVVVVADKRLVAQKEKSVRRWQVHETM